MVAPNTPNKLISDSSYTISYTILGESQSTGSESESASQPNHSNQLPHNHNHNDVIDNLDMNALHDYVIESCDLERNQYIWLGTDRKFGLGFVSEWCQRRSIRSNLQLVCNGLKPVKGSQNKFMINEITDNIVQNCSGSASTVALEYETEVNYSNFVVSGCGGHYPISQTAKVIATSKRSKLFILSLPFHQKEDIIGIRADDGFVLIHSKLSIYSLPKYDKNTRIEQNNESELKSCYTHLENGHLFILGEGGHLLLIDKRNSVHSSRQCILLVGISGVDVFSLNDHKNNGEQSSHKLCAHSSTTTASTANSVINSKRSLNNDSMITSGRHVHLQNGDNYNGIKNEQKMTEIKTKRCTDANNVIDGHVKKQKCEFSSIDCYFKET